MQKRNQISVFGRLTHMRNHFDTMLLRSSSSIETTVDDWYYHLVLTKYLQGARKKTGKETREGAGTGTGARAGAGSDLMKYQII